MSQLVVWTALSGLLVSVAWFAYIVDRILVWGLWPALSGRPEDQPEQSEWAKRHKRAHTVAVELFVAFGPLAALAAITQPENPFPGTLAFVFFCGLFVHNVAYLFGIPVVRTLSFAVSALSTVFLALDLLGVV